MSWYRRHYKIAQTNFEIYFEENIEEDIKPILLRLLEKDVPDDWELSNEIDEAVADLADEVDAWDWMVKEKPKYVKKLKDKAEAQYSEVKEKNKKYRNNPKEAPQVAPPLGSGGGDAGGAPGGDLGGLLGGL